MFTFEHSNYTGKPFWLGYQLYNAGDTPVTATVYNIGYQNDGEWLGQRSWSDYFNLEFRLPAGISCPTARSAPFTSAATTSPTRRAAMRRSRSPSRPANTSICSAARRRTPTRTPTSAARPTARSARANAATARCCSSWRAATRPARSTATTTPRRYRPRRPSRGYIVTRNGKKLRRAVQGRRPRPRRPARDRNRLGRRRRDAGRYAGALHQPPRSRLAEQERALRRLCAAVLYVRRRKLAVRAQPQHQP